MMERNCLIITLDEAKDILVKSFADILQGDRDNLIELIETNSIKSFCPDVNVSGEKLATTLSECDWILDKLFDDSSNCYALFISENKMTDSGNYFETILHFVTTNPDFKKDAGNVLH